MLKLTVIYDHPWAFQTSFARDIPDGEEVGFGFHCFNAMKLGLLKSQTLA